MQDFFNLLALSTLFPVSLQNPTQTSSSAKLLNLNRFLYFFNSFYVSSQTGITLINPLSLNSSIILTLLKSFSTNSCISFCQGSIDHVLCYATGNSPFSLIYPHIIFITALHLGVVYLYHFFFVSIILYIATPIICVFISTLEIKTSCAYFTIKTTFFVQPFGLFQVSSDIKKIFTKINYKP